MDVQRLLRHELAGTVGRPRRRDADADRVFPLAEVLPVCERLRVACPQFSFVVLPGADHHAVGALRAALADVLARAPVAR
jgi:hypothetical protein